MAQRRFFRYTQIIAIAGILCTAAPAIASDDDSELVYECAMALDHAAGKGVVYPVSSARALAQFDEISGGGTAKRAAARKSIEAVWANEKREKGREALDRYIFGVAEDCAGLYAELADKQVQQAEGELNALGTLSAGSLRAYTQRTGDYGAVADYLVYHYPYGKDMFKDNADGDYLGQIIVQIGKDGLIRWSDEAIYSIANKHYWQYNPPATRLVFAEYQRRMRVKRQSETEAQRWAQRAADDRRRQAQQANAKPVGSIGRSCEVEYRPAEPGIPGSRVVKCR
ncbi:MAG: hypothetical protein HC843_03115 [Sphingomonadales bacterium]|nr:hypothetical protein [Sphingomonadales bacterium]